MGAHYTFTEEERTPTGPWPTPATEKDAGPRRWEVTPGMAATGGGGCGGGGGRGKGPGGGDSGDRRRRVRGRAGVGKFERGNGVGIQIGQVKGCDNPKRSAPSRLAPNTSIWVQLAKGVRRQCLWRRHAT